MEFVKDMMPQHFCYQLNHEGKTLEDIFNETHVDLVKEGDKWLKIISNSCSVVATLIATVVFPASTTVPGGISDTSGMPILVKHPIFSVFAISSLVALCASVISLILFLTILASQYQPKDFHSYAEETSAWPNIVLCIHWGGVNFFLCWTVLLARK